MKFFEYLKDKALYLFSYAIILLFSAFVFFTFVKNASFPLFLLLIILYLIGVFVPFFAEYLRKKAFYNTLLRLYDSLDRKNLLTELVSPPDFQEGKLLYELLRGSNKAYLDDISILKQTGKDYREYIELWVHEVKTPISSSKLLIQNNKNEVTESIGEEIEKIEGFVEQVLFYSRSNNVEKDYLVKNLILKNVVFSVLRNNSKDFIQNKVSVVTKELDFTVYSDAKWLEYILCQIVSNSIKYKRSSGAEIAFEASLLANGILLKIIDNGIGIKKSELTRVFDKGFTGSNGRKNSSSTGMGLYICKKLCDKLGLSISLSSELQKGTTVSIVFPKNSLIEENQPYENVSKM